MLCAVLTRILHRVTLLLVTVQKNNLLGPGLRHMVGSGGSWGRALALGCRRGSREAENPPKFEQNLRCSGSDSDRLWPIFIAIDEHAQSCPWVQKV